MEFKRMRRSEREIPESEAIAVLNRATHGVMAVSGDGGYPYAVPVSFVFSAEKIYIHSAAEGHKIDAIKRDGRVSFCVVDEDGVIPEKYTTAYRSAIVFGRARIVENEDEKAAAMEQLSLKYYPGGDAEERRMKISAAMKRLAVIEITAEHISGKSSLPPGERSV